MSADYRDLVIEALAHENAGLRELIASYSALVREALEQLALHHQQQTRRDHHARNEAA